MGLSLQLYPVPNEGPDTDRYKGLNAKRLLVVLAEIEVNSYYDLLSKILRAIGFDIDADINLLVLNPQESVALFSSDIHEQYDRVLLMGVSPRTLGLALDLPIGIQRLEKITVIAGPTLEKVSQDEKVKRAFWSILKTEFEV